MNETNSSPLIDAANIRVALQDPAVVIVDARGGPDARDRFLAAHLPGAVFMDLETDLSSKGPDAAQGGRHPLPDPKAFGILLGKAGISTRSRIIVYDDKAGANAAARFWWMMKAAGHENIRVVDGGLNALVHEGLQLSSEPHAGRAAFDPYPVTAWKLPVVGIQEVDRARFASDALIIDVREAYRYRGESEPIDKVAGHIPGAVNIPYGENLTSEGKFRSPSELADKYRSVIGSDATPKVIVHCGSGVTACHTLLAMEAAGLKGASLYVGSWSEWSRNPKPIAKGERPDQTPV